MLLGALGGLGALLDRFFIDFYRFWPSFGGPFGRVWDVLGSILEVLGSLGASWEVFWSFLESLGSCWVDFTCFSLEFSYFSSDFSDFPAADPSMIHRVPPHFSPIIPHFDLPCFNFPQLPSTSS